MLGRQCRIRSPLFGEVTELGARQSLRGDLHGTVRLSTTT